MGETLTALQRAAPDVRIINLETSLTLSDDVADGKAVHDRMNPADPACLTVAGPDVCTLATNHVLDLGREGLAETLKVLDTADIATASAGRGCAPSGDIDWLRSALERDVRPSGQRFDTARDGVCAAQTRLPRPR